MTRRDLLASSCLVSALGAKSARAESQRRTKFLMLATADGLRWQELFTGIDPQLMNEQDFGMGNDNAAALRNHLWNASPDARRKALMPFFWGTLAPKGIVLGDRKSVV